VPITYPIDVTKRLIRTTAVGQLTQQEVVDHFRELARDAQHPERPDVFLDLSAVDSAPDARQLSIVIGEMKRIGAKLRFGACAILARRDALFGMMRMFEAMAEEFFRETRTFRDTAEAEAWLVSRRSLTGPQPADRN
jgi:hypothetical protein